MMERCETVDQIRPRWFRWFVVCTWGAAVLVVIWFILALVMVLTGRLVPI